MPEVRPRGAPLRILFDVSHPAHVHVFGAVARELVAEGAEVHFAGREKDTTVDLLRASGFPFEILSAAAPRRGRVVDAIELVRRVRRLRRLVRDFQPDVVLTRNPSGVLAALGSAASSVFDTDDGRAVGLHYWLARPFADVITSSVHDPEVHGSRHRRYPGLKAHTFLHPGRFRPDPQVIANYGLVDDGDTPMMGPLFVVRFSAHDASHDRGIVGISPQGQRQVVERLVAEGPVVVSVEGQPTRLLRAERPAVEIAAEHLHHLMAAASLCVTDSQSVAVEASVLGVHTLRLSGFTGHVWYLEFLEERFGLVRNLSPGDEPVLLGMLEDALADLPTLRGEARSAALTLNAETPDVARWFAALAGELSKRSELAAV